MSCNFVFYRNECLRLEVYFIFFYLLFYVNLPFSNLLLLAFLPLLPHIYLPTIGSILFYRFEGFNNIFHFPCTFLFPLFFFMIFYFPIFSILLYVLLFVQVLFLIGHIYCIKGFELHSRVLEYQIMQKSIKQKSKMTQNKC